MPSTGPVIGGAAEGAATGAAIGSVVPGIGTAIGAVVGGVVGGIKGLFSSKSAAYAKKARKMREEVRLISSFLERRRFIQQLAQARSATLAAGLASGAGAESSGIQGAQASLETQTRSNLQKNAEQIFLERQASRLHSKSDTAASNAAALGQVINAAGSLASTFPVGSGYSASAQRMGTGSFQGMGLPPLQDPGAIIQGPLPTPSINSSPFTRG